MSDPSGAPAPATLAPAAPVSVSTAVPAALPADGPSAAVRPPVPAGDPLLVVEGLSVTFDARSARPVRAVRDVSFTLRRGECLAIVGESGSGKSVTARTLVGLTGGRATVSARRLGFDGQDLTRLREASWRRIRGRHIGLVLQDALVSLDPLRTAGAEIAEALRTHRVVDRAEVRPRVLSLLTDVGVPEPAQRAAQYPHQLSGGLRQRALIASALAAGPELLVADEPTTALDVTVQAQVLDLLRGLAADGMSVLLISHDLAVVAGLADQVAVMYGGLVVEQGPTAAVLADPRHPYTQALLAAVPAMHAKGTRLSITPVDRPPATAGCPYAARCPRSDERCRAELPPLAGDEPGHRTLCWHPGPPPPTAAVSATVTAAPAAGVGRTDRVTGAGPLVEVAAIHKRFRSPDGSWRHAVQDVSFELFAGETLGVVGESGSGKTTVARIVLGMQAPDSGTVRFAGAPWSGLPERRRRALRPRIQAVYQDPLGSFDPRFTTEKIIGEALGSAGVRRGQQRRDRVVDLLERVGLAPGLLRRRPLELSGGQRQRVAIARALATEPELLVCDEPVSALDVSVQAQILDLLAGLQHDLGVAMLFISHDLGVIHHISDRLVVMKDGRVVETGPVGQVFAQPAQEYTRALLAAVPRPALT
ncbi:ABC transporter ATP-binding protein [Frankia sp. QA3]|uniref:dipeptide ABC transporter ATP-binding protein n=1 Tax=Frankia sp. QA3 TaxID=710111 RepID=UPI000269C442|nr:ABC transporter ATP-binding protein [Frankia sp. QA3]EIV94792.1 oligopeptide/dipeptide ABC transporter, ATP-binding protein [Frankia sp. QA3]